MNRLRLVAILFLLLTATAVRAQTPAAPAPPPTIRNSTQVPAAPVKAADDGSSAGELPLNTPADQPAKDVTPVASPLPVGVHPGYFLPGTTVRLRLTKAVHSGQDRNGDSIPGVLTAPVTAANGKVLPQGTVVKATIVSSAAAGKIASYGILTLQLYKVGGVGVYSNVLEFSGHEGTKVQADSAPAKGSEAAVSRGMVLTFKVLGAGNGPDQTDRPEKTGIGHNATHGQVTPPAPGNSLTTPAPGMTQPH